MRRVAHFVSSRSLTRSTASRTTDHLLDAGFQDILSPSEREFALLLDKVLHESSAQVKATEAYKQLERFIYSTYGGHHPSAVQRVILEVPFRVKPNLTVRKLIHRLSKVYMIENLDIEGIYRFVLGDSAPILNKRVMEVATDGAVWVVSGVTLLHMLSSGEQLGLKSKEGNHRKRVTLHVRFCFVPSGSSPPPSPGAADPNVVKCHFWASTGACRLGYTCHMLHEGLPDRRAAVEDINNDNNQPQQQQEQGRVGPVQIQAMLPSETPLHLEIPPAPPLLPPEQQIPVRVVDVQQETKIEK